MFENFCHLLTIIIIFFFSHRSLWNMRNYIHCMLCANLIAAQLVFVVGVERTENKVKSVLLSSHSSATLLHTGCLFSHCCVDPLPVPGGVHVDANGGCGLVRETSDGFHQTPQAIHSCFHCS